MRHVSLTLPPVRIVQRKCDGRFYAGPGLWREHADAARHFQSAMQALEDCGELWAISGEIVFTTVPDPGESQLVKS